MSDRIAAVLPPIPSRAARPLRRSAPGGTGDASRGVRP